MKRYSLYTFAAVLLVALVWVGCSTDRGPTGPGTIGVATKPAGGDVAAVMAVQNRHTDRLLAVRGIVGTATGLGPDGSPVIKVYTEAAGVAGIPESLEGVPVRREVTGKIVALGNSRYPRPAPIGVSTANAREIFCVAGTIGCRVTKGTSVYALSNNHVFARENKAKLGEKILQPGPLDNGCVLNLNDAIATLAAFVKIQFSIMANNTVDAAIASSSTANLGNATPSADGYGTPGSTPVSAFLGQAVQKYGRTTHLTHGTVTGINVTVLIGYSGGKVARFVDQIQIGPGGFGAGGDSGSLIVTDDANANPVGLLFAGSSTTIIANRIQNVLNAFSVTVDGQ